MNKTERSLLKRLAETHAFIYDLRQIAIARVDPLYIRKTSGIDETIDAFKAKYPRVYIRYFKQAVKKATNDGQKKDSKGREEGKKTAPSKKEKEEVKIEEEIQEP